MRESAVIRLLDDQLVWYPPGSSEDPRPLEDEDQQYQLVALAEARRAPILFAVPGGDVTLRDVAITAAEKRHIARSLPFMLEEEFATDIEDLHFASRPLDKLELGVASCTHAAMLRWQELLETVPAASQWIPEPLLLPWRPGELCVVVERQRVVVRSGRNDGFTAERELAAAMLAALPADCAETVIVYGLDQSLDAALLPDWMQALMQWRTGNFAAALMLAEEEKQPLNLRQGAYGARLPLERWWQQWRVAAGLFGVAFLLQLGGTYAAYANLEQENLQLRQQLESSFRQVFPRGRMTDRPAKQITDEINELRGDSSSLSFVGMMGRIAPVIAAQDGAQLASVNFNEKLGDVRISLVVADFGGVEAIRTGLDAAGLNAVTENSNASGDRVRARLKVSNKP